MENTAFETFAKFYPVEAHAQNKELFREYFRKQVNSDWSDNSIDEYVNEMNEN